MRVCKASDRGTAPNEADHVETLRWWRSKGQHQKSRATIATRLAWQLRDYRVWYVRVGCLASPFMLSTDRLGEWGSLKT